MDLRLHSYYSSQRHPDWAAAATAGFAAGAAVMVLELFWSAVVSNHGPWVASHLVAAIVLGPALLHSSAFSVTVVAVALLAHYALGIAYGLLLAAIMAHFRLDLSLGKASLAGAVFGALLYLLNFHGMTHFFPWFIDWRGTEALFTHLVFGVAAALLYRKFNRQM
jgi:hypothetical protein